MRVGLYMVIFWTPRNRTMSAGKVIVHGYPKARIERKSIHYRQSVRRGMAPTRSKRRGRLTGPTLPLRSSRKLCVPQEDLGLLRRQSVEFTPQATTTRCLGRSRPIPRGFMEYGSHDEEKETTTISNIGHDSRAGLWLNEHFEL